MKKDKTEPRPRPPPPPGSQPSSPVTPDPSQQIKCPECGEVVDFKKDIMSQLRFSTRILCPHCGKSI